jgi:hypothetical protein
MTKWINSCFQDYTSHLLLSTLQPLLVMSWLNGAMECQGESIAKECGQVTHSALTYCLHGVFPAVLLQPVAWQMSVFAEGLYLPTKQNIPADVKLSPPSNSFTIVTR